MSNIAVEAMQGSIPVEAQQAKAFINEALACTLPAPFTIPSGLGAWQDVVVAIAEDYREAAFGPGGSIENARASVQRLVDMMKERSEPFKALLEADEDELPPVPMSEIAVPPLPERSRPDPKLARQGRTGIEDFVDFSNRWAPFADMTFHENAALLLLSIITARRLVIKGIGTPMYTGLYFFFIGPSSCGKSTVMKNMMFVVKELGLKHLMATSKTTPEAFKRKASGYIPDDWDIISDEKQEMLKAKMAFHGKTALISDEWGQLLRRILNPSGYMFEWLSIYLSWEDSTAEDGQDSITNGSQEINDPYMPMGGCMTFTNLQRLPANSDLWGSGLMARAVMACAVPSEYRETEMVTGDINVEERYLNRLKNYHHRLGHPSIEIEKREKAKDSDKPSKKYEIVEENYPCQEIHLAKEVEKAYNNYRNDVGRIGHDPMLVPEELQPNYRRFSVKALRVAAMLAFYDGEVVIQLRHWHAACEIAERWRAFAHFLYAQCNGPQVSVKKSTIDSVMNYITKQSKQKKPRWVSVSDIENDCKKAEEEWIKGVESKIKTGEVIRATRIIKSTGGTFTKYALVGTPPPGGYTIS